MTIALPRSQSQNNLLHKLTTQWNSRITSPKFNNINPWIRAYINDTVEGFFGEIIKLISLRKLKSIIR